MATNIRTVITYALDGSKTDFTIPFEYLARKFVVVTLIGVDRRELILTTDYRFATKTVISTTTAWGAAQGYTSIEIRRFTSATERLVDFTDGSILRAYDLNVSQLQTIHVAEEARDMTAETIGVNNDGNLDARGRRIVNVADAVDSGDAINLGQVLQQNQNAWQARNEAQGFRNEAEIFRADAQAFRDSALTQANNSSVSASASANSAAASANSATQSGLTAVASSQTADLSRRWASEVPDTVVANGMYSARHYSVYASQFRDAAQTGATTATTQADRAKTEADRAKSEADKLGNWNLLAGTVESVTGVNVRWKGEHIAPYYQAVSDAGRVALRSSDWSMAKTPSVYLMGYRTQPDLVTLRLGANNEDPALATSHGVFGAGSQQFMVFGNDGATTYLSGGNVDIRSQSGLTITSPTTELLTTTIELGNSHTTGAESTQIDFHSSQSYSDYSARIQVVGGTSNVGSGVMSIYAGTTNIRSATFNVFGDSFNTGAIHTGSGAAKLNETGNIEASRWTGGNLSSHIATNRAKPIGDGGLRKIWQWDINGRHNSHYDANSLPLPSDASHPVVMQSWGAGSTITLPESVFGKVLYSSHSDTYGTPVGFLREWGRIPNIGTGVLAHNDAGVDYRFVGIEMMIGVMGYHFRFSQDGRTISIQNASSGATAIFAIWVADNTA